MLPEFEEFLLDDLGVGGSLWVERGLCLGREEAEFCELFLKFFTILTLRPVHELGTDVFLQDLFPAKDYCFLHNRIPI